MYNRPLEYNWKCKPFDSLSVQELYGILRLRTEVFILEQNCLYQDVDGKDVKAKHLFASHGETIDAYLRILPPGVSYPDASIGRVATAKGARGKGLGKQLMFKAMEYLKNEDGNPPVRISAQSYLVKFYEGFGFSTVGDEYLEDNIPHIQMLYTP